MTLIELAGERTWARDLLLAEDGHLLAVAEDGRERAELFLPLGSTETAWWINVFCASLEIGFTTSEASVRRLRARSREIKARGKWFPAES